MACDHEKTGECSTCGAKTRDLRRGRCVVCYLRWTDSRPVGVGAACVTCGDRRRYHLRSVELHGRWVPMCHNCAGRAFRLDPTPPTLEELRECLQRDRRWGDRREGADDKRVFQIDRRIAARRIGRFSLDGQYIDAADLVIEALDEPEDDPTLIMSAPPIDREYDGWFQNP